ncbi:hypothetical protein SNE40_013121 [Patella caerulea]|uniref:Uncharacterized protein n=1 Tax=Patella caerulea TaxID=87958 RepID=A0AAN8JJ08_PATCE
MVVDDDDGTKELNNLNNLFDGKQKGGGTDVSIHPTTSSTSSTLVIIDKSSKLPEGFVDIMSQYNKDDQYSASIDDGLAKVSDNNVKFDPSEDKVNELLNKYKRPGNCEFLEVTKVNPPVWEFLSSETISNDLKLQRIQNMIISGLIPLARLSELLMKKAVGGDGVVVKHGFRLLTDSMALLASANADIIGRKRIWMKGDVHQNYRSLCTLKGDNGTLLFGSDLSQKLKDIFETNRVSQKANNRNYGYRDRHSNCNRFSPYSGGRKPFNRNLAMESNSGQRFFFRESPETTLQKKVWTQFQSQCAQQDQQQQTVTNNLPNLISINKGNDEVCLTKSNLTEVNINAFCHFDNNTFIPFDLFPGLAGSITFISGQIGNFVDVWKLCTFSGINIEFSSLPFQKYPPTQHTFHNTEREFISSEIIKLSHKKVIEQCEHVGGEFLSTIVFAFKKGRIISNDFKSKGT